MSHPIIVLKSKVDDIPTGSIGTVVHQYKKMPACEVEFRIDGQTIVKTLLIKQFEMKTKLSVAQEAALTSLRLDPLKRITYVKGAKDYTYFTRCQGLEKITVTTAQKLISEGLVESDGAALRPSDTNYQLTELGKNINLK